MLKEQIYYIKYFFRFVYRAKLSLSRPEYLKIKTYDMFLWMHKYQQKGLHLTKK